ncbi:dTDP-4-dehydrorhamnose 3,5-epimerase family protein [Streptomyces sulfonofaciens]|nr:dTDP-4-dehydrorhamnose 3,5-epimerase family protein [Streptomyces sulfonofaciens]
MQVRRLAVDGAYAFSPQVFRDDRGLVVSHFQEDALVGAIGRPLFPVAHASHSTSRRGTVRGIHFTATPPGTAKYVYCPRGRTLDIVVDIRVGSPTFGRWDSEVLDPEGFRAVYLPIGVGHAAVALEDHTIMHYMWSGPYVAEQEMALAALDPALALPLPGGIEPVLSPRDSAAPTLAEAGARGILPRYDECRKLEEALAGARPTGPGTL